MCLTCGCGNGAKARIDGEPLAPQSAHEHVHVLPDGTRIVHRHDHQHEHDHGHAHAHHHETPGEIIPVETSLLDKNQRIAARNRAWLAGRGVLALNLMSSPGAGKTSLLVRTLTDLRGEMAMCVVEGDQETSADAERIRATGARAIQINTGTGCHLEADMLERAMQTLQPEAGGVLFVENVGNLVCPALFDLGEAARVVMLSVAEGEDKPLKYPHMFASAQLLLTTKTDLLPYVPFDVERAEANARAINPGLRCLRVSTTGAAGLGDWYDWLRETSARARRQAVA